MSIQRFQPKAMAAPDQDAIAAFLAKKEVTVVGTGVRAYTNKEIRTLSCDDKYLKPALHDDDSEGEAERYREEVNDAYMAGGSRARDEVMARGRR